MEGHRTQRYPRSCAEYGLLQPARHRKSLLIRTNLLEVQGYQLSEEDKQTKTDIKPRRVRRERGQIIEQRKSIGASTTSPEAGQRHQTHQVNQLRNEGQINRYDSQSTSFAGPQRSLHQQRQYNLQLNRYKLPQPCRKKRAIPCPRPPTQNLLRDQDVDKVRVASSQGPQEHNLLDHKIQPQQQVHQVQSLLGQAKIAHPEHQLKLPKPEHPDKPRPPQTQVLNPQPHPQQVIHHQDPTARPQLPHPHHH